MYNFTSSSAVFQSYQDDGSVIFCCEELFSFEQNPVHNGNLIKTK